MWKRAPPRATAGHAGPPQTGPLVGGPDRWWPVDRPGRRRRRNGGPRRSHGAGPTRWSGDPCSRAPGRRPPRSGRLRRRTGTCRIQEADRGRGWVDTSESPTEFDGVFGAAGPTRRERQGVVGAVLTPQHGAVRCRARTAVCRTLPSKDCSVPWWPHRAGSRRRRGGHSGRRYRRSDSSVEVLVGGVQRVSFAHRDYGGTSAGIGRTSRVRTRARVTTRTETR